MMPVWPPFSERSVENFYTIRFDLWNSFPRKIVFQELKSGLYGYSKSIYFLINSGIMVSHITTVVEGKIGLKICGVVLFWEGF